MADTVAAEIIMDLAKKDKVSKTELAKMMGISRNGMYLMLGGDMSTSRFLKLLDLLGYGITIRPKNNVLVDQADKDMCDNCVHKKLSEALSNVRSVDGLDG